MAARQYQTSVGTSATAIEGTQYPGWLLKNNGAETIFLGDSAVTTGTGFPIEPEEVFSPSELGHNSIRGLDEDRLFGIAAASTDVRVLIQGKANV